MPEQTREQLLQRAQLLQKAAEIRAKQMEKVDPPSKLEEMKSAPENLLDKSTDLGLKMADTILGGAPIRAAVGKMAGVLTDKEWTGEDNTMTPGYGEIMRRKGVPEAAKLSDYVPGYAEPGEGGLRPEKGGLLDPSIRGTVGTVMDMALSPASIMSFLTKQSAAYKAIQAERARELAQKTMSTAGQKTMDVLRASAQNPVSAISSPISNSLEYLGNRMYKKGVEPLDRATVKTGKGPVSSRLIDDNVVGTSAGIQRHMLNKSAELETKAGKLASQMDYLDPVIPDIWGNGNVSGGVNMERAMDKGANAALALSGRPVLAEANDAMNASIQAHKDLGVIPRQKAITLKGDLYRVMPDTVFDQTVRTPPGQAVRSQMARGIKEATEAVPPGSGPYLTNMGKELGQTTEEWGHYLDAQHAAERMANKSANAKLIRPGMIYSGGVGAAIGGAGAGGKIAGTRALLDLWRATPFRTTMGWGMNRLGASPYSKLLDAWARDQLLGEYRPQGPEEQGKK